MPVADGGAQAAAADELTPTVSAPAARAVRAPAARAAASSSTLLAVGLLLIGAAAAVAIAAVSATSVHDQIRWGAISLGAFCAGLLPLMSAAAGHDGLGLSSWRIGPWTLVWGSLAFGLATMSWNRTQSGSPAIIADASILRALWMIAAAFALLTLGYCAGPYRLLADRASSAAARFSRRYTSEVRSPLAPWALAAVGLVAQFGYAFLTGHFGYVGNAAGAVSTASGYSQYLAVAGECVPLSVLAAAIRAYHVRTPGAWVTLAALFGTDIAAGAVAGGKESFVVAILAVIMPYSVIRRRLPAGVITTAVLVFLLVVIPFNQAYRTSARGAVTLSTGQAIAAAPAIASQVADSDISLSVLAESASYLSERIRTIDTPAIIMQQTPAQIPYASPVELLTAPFADLIPRILWPGKPILAPGYEISQEYFQLPAQVYTSSDVTPEGDLYRHGGWVELIIGMFLLGCVIRIIDEVADLRRGVHGAFLVLLLFPAVVQAGSDWAALLAGIPGMVLLYLAVVRLTFARRISTAARLTPAGRRYGSVSVTLCHFPG
jgi:hypothetical protein